MDCFDKFVEAGNELVKIEERLKEEDFTDYSGDALDFEKSELSKAWTKYKKLYDECSSEEAKEKKEVMVQTNHKEFRKVYIRCINIIAAARKSIVGEKIVTQSQVPQQVQGFSCSVPPCDTGVFHGSYEAWPTFRDMFTAIFIKNTRLSPVEKLFYLYQKTEGEAREVNRNVALTESVSEILNNNQTSESQSFSSKNMQASSKPKQFKAHHTKAEVSQCHMYNDCSRPNACPKCNKKHHSLLHRDFTRKPEQNKKTDVSQNANSALCTQIQSIEVSNPSNVAQVHHTVVARNVMLATAWINIISYGVAHRVRALIDPCSDENFVSKKVSKLLKLPTMPVSAEVTGLGGELVSRSEKLASFTIKPIKNEMLSLKVDALVVPEVTGKVPTHSINATDSFSLPKIDLADPEFYKSGPVDILLGGNLYPEILRSGVQHGVFESLVAQETIFGWIVTGPSVSRTQTCYTRVCHVTSVSLDEQLSKFWELEEIYRTPIGSEEDRRYVALRQCERNEKTLMRRPELKSQYDEVMREYITLGHMEKVDDSTYVPSYYLPHHGVFKYDSTTTQLRVVFNGSSPSSNGRSLNDNLYIGPTLQQDLVALLTRWRFYRFVFSADITKMYRQILVNPKHTDFQRILFRCSEDEEIQEYRLKTVTFGINCAPYLALRTLLQLADDEEKRFPIGSKILREAMYVDDALVGSHSIEECLVARDQLIGILSSAKFDLRKWTSNSKDILKDLPLESLLNSSFLCLEDDSRAKMLGVRWNATTDCFYFVTEVVQVKTSYTKRQVLSMIARIFDPAGWLAPIIIRAKILMQQMWLDQIGWDEPITPLALQSWLNFISNFNKIDQISVPRWLKFSSNCAVQIHGFCDSSELAYAANVYVRINNGDEVFSNLLMAKTKVAPIKKATLPRLELSGATLLANLIDNVKKNFEHGQYELFLWSDSTIVLAWLRKHPSYWKTFVANRVSLILDKVGNIKWRHVVSDSNPADLATRGLTAAELQDNSLWWHGPEWLGLDERHWPSSITDFQTAAEEKRVKVLYAKSSKEKGITLKEDGNSAEESGDSSDDKNESSVRKKNSKKKDFLEDISTLPRAVHVQPVKSNNHSFCTHIDGKRSEFVKLPTTIGCKFALYLFL
ncbi:uncharacterized protein [Musca autumnalis]|uniref:uncharacterized protein n=1 Tax=Musca autumnalis TaxID=221902 RepID=UPI003CFA3F68